MTGSQALPGDAAGCGLALFEDRLIFEAQPPITDADLAEVERRIGTAVPPGLLALWRVAFGGRVGYDLQVEFDDHVAGFSFNEIFYPDSDGYRDLWGWIEHERELAEEAEGGPVGRLRYLPFGGFEYLDRVYVCLEDADHGAVYAWMQGLPAAWALRLHEDSVARIADDVPALFRLLALDDDPFQGGGGYNAADEAVDAIGEIEAEHPDVADAARAAIGRAVLDWRAALDGGSLAASARLRRLAFRQVARDGDLALADRMAAQGCDLGERYGGGGNLVDQLLAQGHDAAAGVLIDRGLDVRQSITAAAASLLPDRTRQLIALGAEVTPIAAGTAAVRGDETSARLMADALDREGLAELARSLADTIAGNESAAARVESGKMGSSMTPAEYRAQAAAADRLRRHAEERLSGG